MYFYQVKCSYDSQKLVNQEHSTLFLLADFFLEKVSGNLTNIQDKNIHR